MTSKRSDQLLLPVNPLFIGATLLAALAFELVPFGRQPALPDLLALALVFWNVHQPRRVGVGIAFAFGLVLDVHDGAVLGQHALAYTLLAFFAVTIHRRPLWFTVPSQAVQIRRCSRRASCHRRAHARGACSWLGVRSRLCSVLLGRSGWLLRAAARPPDPDQNGRYEDQRQTGRIPEGLPLA
jgi:rod shape-determining protein MreD